MSTWNLGIDDISEETRAFKDKISSKDSQIAAQQDKLLKRAEEYEELKEKLNEALHKLANETHRSLQLETDLQQRSDDLRNERIASENAKSALSAALQKNKGGTLELRQLEVTLERISHTSDEHKAYGAKLEKEKAMLEARVREMESNLRQPTTPGRRTVFRPRSSSLSNLQITTLEQDLLDARGALAKKEMELKVSIQKLSQVQNDLIKADNEKLAIERKMKSQVEALQASLEETADELAFLKGQQSDVSREEELLKRIDEDDAKIQALEALLKGERGTKGLKDKLIHLETQLKDEQRRSAATEDHQIELVKEKEETLDELEHVRKECQRLGKELRERKQRDSFLKEKAERSLELFEDPLIFDNSGLIDTVTLEPSPATIPTTPHAPMSPVEPDPDMIFHIERLLRAIDRLRSERDGLRQDVEFLESESRFTIEALEAKLSASSSTVTDNESVLQIHQLKAEMDDLHAQLEHSKASKVNSIRMKNIIINRQAVQVQALAVVLRHSRSYLEAEPMPTVAGQRDELLDEIQYKDSQREKDVDSLKLAEKQIREQLDEAMHQMSELSVQLEDAESERDALALEVTNLTIDLEIAQKELANAENRYTTLQFHQLSEMSSHEATRTLREHIEEVEGRVGRRNELIGILQHDIRRLETNIKLQDERLGEMTMELDMMAAEKNAMVEDCADAREARNEALARVELLEEDMETSDNRYKESQVVIMSLIASIVETVCGARSAIRAVRCQSAEAESKLVAVQQASSNSLTGKVTVVELQTENKQLQDRLRTLESNSAIDEDANRQLVQLKIYHAEALGVLQGRLVETESALEELQTQYSSSEDDHLRNVEDMTMTIQNLNEQLSTAMKNLSDLQQVRDQLCETEKVHLKNLSELQDKLGKASQDYMETLRSSEAIQAENLTIQQELERKVQSLQGRFEEETRLLDISKEEAARLSLRLQEEVEGRSEDQKTRSTALALANKDHDRIRSTLSRVQDELASTRKDYEACQVLLDAKEEEKISLLENITAIEAEAQKSKSLSRHLEIQISNSEYVVSTLKSDIERLNANLAEVEKACKAAEVNLSLQNAQHKRETAEFQRELTALRTKPNLERALAKLEERNNEMEELLRTKCAEIEENDDRVLEMLKDKKKLTAKVESLNRKIQNLQAKLAAAKASNALPGPSSDSPPPAVPPMPVQTPQTFAPPCSRPRSATVSNVPPTPQLSTSTPQNVIIRQQPQQHHINRIVSGPSSLLRPKTPERNKTITPVFKARTPERYLMADVVPEPSSVVIGKKRSKPDDFEAIENIPVQAFTADVEEVENKTPRVRRVLSNLQSGFTPVRNQSNRPTAPMPSPKRSLQTKVSSHFPDLTNSPFQHIQVPPIPPLPDSTTKSSTKRSWLGKIRGTSQPRTDKTRSRVERGDYS